VSFAASSSKPDPDEPLDRLDDDPEPDEEDDDEPLDELLDDDPELLEDELLDDELLDDELLEDELLDGEPIPDEELLAPDDEDEPLIEVGTVGESHPRSKPLAATAPPDNKIRKSRRFDRRCVCSSSVLSGWAPGVLFSLSVIALLTNYPLSKGDDRAPRSLHLENIAQCGG
jgi:hypothetical protein